MPDLPAPSEELLPDAPGRAYVARFPGRSRPASWAPLLTGLFHAVLESGPTGRHTVVVPAADSVRTLAADGSIQEMDEGCYWPLPGRGAADFLADLGNVAPPPPPGWPRFRNGWILALGYEAAGDFEPVRAAPEDLGLPRAVLLAAGDTLTFDAHTGDLVVVVAPRPDFVRKAAVGEDLAALRVRAAEFAARWDAACAAPPPALRPAGEPAPILGETLDAVAFAEAARRAQAYIAAGDTYQVNLSTRLELPAPADPLLAYEAVRATNPSPYMSYLRGPGFTLVCGSPELLVEAVGDRIASRPIAGTRPRTGRADEDGAFARELAADSKERAEHLMLVDLLRNDVGRVAAPGTVRVPEFMAVERYSHVMHLVSQVEGALASPRPTPALVIRALFPGGTVTGAPKVRTMQVIAELEPVARGFYTGSVGWIDFSGDLCLNIVIRTLVQVHPFLPPSRCFVQAGAGVVADSVPGREHDESLRKALALRVALARALPA
ncbi:MAG: anthranilate synthase component I family protein [Opitutia bacterium]